MSWEGGGTPGSRLKDWLDPQNSGVTNTITLDPINDYQIQGTDAFCGSRDYSILNLPCNSTVTWSVSPLGIISVSTSGNIATVTKVSDGTVTLTATITNVGNSIPPLQKTITLIDPPALSVATYTDNGTTSPLAFFDDNSYNNVCNGYNVNTDVEFTGAGSISWSQISSSGYNNFSQDGNNINFYLYSLGETSVFQVNASNGCGTYTQQFGFQSVDCSGGGCNPSYIIFPNPVSISSIKIVPDHPQPCDLSAVVLSDTASSVAVNSNAVNKVVHADVENKNIHTDKSSIKRIRVFDLSGHLRKDVSYSTSTITGQVDLDIHELKSGAYLVEISNNKGVQQVQKLIVSHQ